MARPLHGCVGVNNRELLEVGLPLAMPVIVFLPMVIAILIAWPR